MHVFKMTRLRRFQCTRVVRSGSYTVVFMLFALLFVGTQSAAQATTITVPAGGDLQAALNSAQFGDTIVLQAGATYNGPFVLPHKPGANGAYITIRTSAPDSSLPPEGHRITPAYANVLPKIVSTGSNEPAIRAALRAQYYRFVGVEVTMSSAPTSYQLVTLIELGDPSATDIADAPHHIIFDRCYIHGQPTSNLRRAIALNSEHTEILNSYISDAHSLSDDSQAISGWNGRGPFQIINNYLEGAGEKPYIRRRS